jgi:hypothetical protein
MTNLVSALIQDKLESRKQAQCEYADLLRKYSDAPPPPESVQRLKQLMDILGRDAVDVKEDAEILRVLGGYEAQAAQGEGVGEKLRAAELAANHSGAKTKEAIAKLQAEHAKTLQTYRDLKHRHDVAEEAGGRSAA